MMQQGLIQRAMPGGMQPEPDADQTDPTQNDGDADNSPEEQQEGSADNSAEEQQEGEGESFTPEEAKQLDAFVGQAMKGLYDAKAAKDIASALKTASSVSTTLASTTYDIVAAVDEKTGGQLDDELLAPAAMQVLGEIIQIGQAADVNIQGRDIGMATRMMLQRFMEEAGADPSQLGQAFGKVDPNQVGAQIDGVMGQDDAPQGQPAPQMQGE